VIYLLDTNASIALLNDRRSPVTRRLATVQRSHVFLCQIVKAELYYGAYKSKRRSENLAVLQQFFSQFNTLPFDDKALEIYGRIRAELAAKGTPIGPNDVIIAATALSHNAILVTHNTREFERVTDLKIEDWAELS